MLRFVVDLQASTLSVYLLRCRGTGVFVCADIHCSAVELQVCCDVGAQTACRAAELQGCRGACEC